MNFNDFFSRLSSLGAESIDYRNVGVVDGQLRTIGKMSFQLPLLGKTIVASVGAVDQGEYFQITPTWTLVKEPTPHEFLHQIEDMLFGACTSAVYNSTSL